MKLHTVDNIQKLFYLPTWVHILLPVQQIIKKCWVLFGLIEIIEQFVTLIQSFSDSCIVLLPGDSNTKLSNIFEVNPNEKGIIVKLMAKFGILESSIFYHSGCNC